MSTWSPPGGAVDVHAHYFPPEYVHAARDLLGDPGVPPDSTGFLTSYEPLDHDPTFTGAFDERLRLMDEAGIAIQVLSFSAGNVWHPDPAARSDVVKRFNDGCVEVVDRHPSRFLLFANMPLPFVDESIAETERATSFPGFVGIGVCTHFAGIAIDDPRWDPLYEMWDALGLTVFVHPDGFCAPAVLPGHFLGWSIGAPFDDTIAAVRLMTSGILQRFPNITWVIPHVGGVLPFLLERVDRVWGTYAHILPEGPPPRETYKNLVFDTATPSVRALALTMEFVETRRLVLGTDFPFANRQALAPSITLLNEAGLSPEDVEQVLTSNPREYLARRS